MQNDKQIPFSAKFISIEGSEGCGKSSQLLLMRDFLAAQNIPVIITREPGGTPMAEAIRGLLLTPTSEKTIDEPVTDAIKSFLLTPGNEKVADETELLLMFAARSQHVSQFIKPALAAGIWVLSDRFLDSTHAYQKAGRGMSESAIELLENMVLGDFRPDMTILLDVPVEIGMERAKNRGKLDRIEQEQMSFFKRVRCGFLDRAVSYPDRIQVIDATSSIEVVQAKIAQHLSVLVSAAHSDLEDKDLSSGIHFR